MVAEPGEGDDSINSKQGEGGVLGLCAQRLTKACSRKNLHRRLPILNWLPRYSGGDALGDLVAGVTVGLTVIPQSLAYSNVAGVPPEVCIHFFFFPS